jgi:hypothetical protein
MQPTYSTDSDLDNVVFVAEDGSAFSKEELEDLILTGTNPHTKTPLTERDITVLHQLVLGDDEDEDEDEEEVEYVDYKPLFKYPYLTMYSLMAIQLGYIIWAII